jgi:hypothetical protein
VSASSRPRAYSITDSPLPFGRNTHYRWEKAGLIKLVRIGGKTLISAETVDDILNGKIKQPDHPARRKRPEPTRRKGRPRKPRPEELAPTAD